MPKTLLLADDSITIQKVVAITFASEDVKVTAVDNGEDALAKARELRPDVILADVVMPRRNGYELCEAVKSDPALRHIPVLLLAGTFEAFDEARARGAHADGHVSKPFESQALINKVRELLGEPPIAAPSPYRTAAAGPAPAAQAPVPSQRAPLAPPAGARPPGPGAPGPRPLAAVPAGPARPHAPGMPPPGARPAPGMPPGARPPAPGMPPGARPGPVPMPGAPAGFRPGGPLPPGAARPGPMPPGARPPMPGLPPGARPGAMPPPGARPPAAGMPLGARPAQPGARPGAMPPSGARPSPTPLPRPSAPGPAAPAARRDPFGFGVQGPQLGAGGPAQRVVNAPVPAPAPETDWSDLDLGAEPAAPAAPAAKPSRAPERDVPVAAPAALELPGTPDEVPELAPMHAFVPPAATTGHAPAGPAADGGEAALRAALTQASREVIERVVWEVVPELAETIIRENLDRLVKQRQG